MCKFAHYWAWSTKLSPYLVLFDMLGCAATNCVELLHILQKLAYDGGRGRCLDVSSFGTDTATDWDTRYPSKPYIGHRAQLEPQMCNMHMLSVQQRGWRQCSTMCFEISRKGGVRAPNLSEKSQICLGSCLTSVGLSKSFTSQGLYS